MLTKEIMLGAGKKMGILKRLQEEIQKKRFPTDQEGERIVDPTRTEGAGAWLPNNPLEGTFLRK